MSAADLQKPLAIDLFCGLGGWTEGLLAEGWRVRPTWRKRRAAQKARAPSSPNTETESYD